VLLGKHFLPFRRNVVHSSGRVQRSEMNVFHFVTINLLPLTLSRLQCVLFYVCHHSVP
jgi:hypothetical protein